MENTSLPGGRPDKNAALRKGKNVFIKLAEDRYSVRSFSSKLRKGKVELILKAGQLHPQPAIFSPSAYWYESSEAIEKLKMHSCHFNAPTALLVCYDVVLETSHDGNDGAVDASIVSTHMMLEAADLGLGTTWVGFWIRL